MKLSESMLKTRRVLTEKEWHEEGKRLFGENTDTWRFRCPSCGHVASVGDYRLYEEKGAKPGDAYFNCIGRWMGDDVGTIGDGRSPCNYSSGGVLCFNTIIVELEDGEHLPVFEFAEPEVPASVKEEWTQKLIKAQASGEEE